MVRKAVHKVAPKVVRRVEVEKVKEAGPAQQEIPPAAVVTTTHQAKENEQTHKRTRSLKKPPSEEFMYKLYINGAFRGNYQTPEQAMVDVQKWARPHGHSWVIKDPFNKIYAQG